MKPRTEPCPVLDTSLQVSGLAISMRRAIQHLRRDLAACSACPAGSSCPARQAFVEQTQHAIQQVLEEWEAPLALAS